MKKYLFGVLALVSAVGLSAFTGLNKPTTPLYYWFEQPGEEFVGTSASPDVNPLGCYATGTGCIKGFLLSEPPEEQPTGTPNREYAHN